MYDAKKAELAEALRAAKRELDDSHTSLAEELVEQDLAAEAAEQQQQQQQQEQAQAPLLRSVPKSKGKARKLVAQAHEQLASLSQLLSELDEELG